MGKKHLQETQQYWDQAAPFFDDEPDHGLHDLLVLQSWTERLAAWLPAPQASVLDIGCGTGSLSVIAAQAGHTVTAGDLSPAMLELARAKAAACSLSIAFQVFDAADPKLPPAAFNAILCRHLLWALPQPGQVLLRWEKLLKPGGRLILIEGFWSTGAGLRADEITRLLPPAFTSVRVEDLSSQTNLWGRPVSDERFAVIADH